MVQTMGKGLYSMSTVVQGEKLGQFLDTEMPSMDDLKVCLVSCLPSGLIWIFIISSTVYTYGIYFGITVPYSSTEPRHATTTLRTTRNHTLS